VNTLLLMALVACSDKGDDSGPLDDTSSDTTGTPGTTTDDSGTDDTGPVEPGMELLANNIEAGALLSAWSNGDELIFAGGEISGAGGGYYVRYDGSSFCYEADVADRAFWWIHGAAEGDWYAVGERGLILHHTGGEHVDESVPTDVTLYGAFDEGDRTWAVGGDASKSTGEIWVREAGVWSLAHTGDGPFFKAWCDGEGSCLFNGAFTSWAVEGDRTNGYEPSPAPDAHLLTCRGRDWTDVWCVGGTSGSEVWRWDGSAWSEADASGLGQPLMGVWTAPGEDVWVSGMSAIVGVWDGSAWTVDIPVAIEPFHATWKHGDDFFFAGGNLTTTSGDFYGTIGHYGQPLGTQDVTACP